MKIFTSLFPKLLFSTFLTLFIFSCEETTDPAPEPEPEPTPGEIIERPFTSIPDEMVGTWYADHNSGPLTLNWEQGTFQGEAGFREFRTLVFTKDGKNAVEYTSEVFNVNDEVRQRLYKITGTLEYKSNPASITFHAQSGKMRIFSNKYSGYKESDILRKDLENYSTVLINPEATTFTSSPNYLTAKRVDGDMQLSAKYKKVEGTSNPGGNPNPTDPYGAPPATGTYVKINNQYYPTVTIGDLEWMSVNYAGNGGIKLNSKPEYGTFIKYMDLKDVPVPAGWRIPTKQDYLKLLRSQGIAFDEVWETTNGSDVQSKRLLGQLMATTGWLKQDGYANNKSGFNAVPGNLQVTNGNPHGEGSNCLLWTSDKDDEDNPVVFKIIQLPSDTYASFGPSIIGYNPPHIPLRLVKNK
jgi:uncharacterized protein (TIGR02145 family)